MILSKLFLVSVTKKLDQLNHPGREMEPGAVLKTEESDLCRAGKIWEETLQRPLGAGSCL